MAELFKLTVLKYVKLPDGAMAVAVKTYEVAERVLQLIAQDPRMRRDGGAANAKPDGTPQGHRITAGPQSSDASIEVVQVEWTGRTGQSNCHAGALPVALTLDEARVWCAEHKAEGWAVPEL